MANELEVEKRKTDELLCELMPTSVADSLRQGKTMEASKGNLKHHTNRYWIYEIPYA